MEIKPSDIEVLILAGGLGTRLRSSIGENTPKALALVSGSVFLDKLLDEFLKADLKQFRICIGHLAGKIREHYLNGYKNATILFSDEPEPLGTGGAVLNALNAVQKPFVLVANGDTILRFDLNLVCAAITTGIDAVSIAAVVEDSTRYGTFLVDDELRVIAQNAPEASGEGLVYAGLTLIRTSALREMELPTPPYGFESGVLGRLITAGKLRVAIINNEFLDIGTADSYKKAQSYDFK